MFPTEEKTKTWCSKLKELMRNEQLRRLRTPIRIPTKASRTSFAWMRMMSPTNPYKEDIDIEDA